jgi:hypothetical protein
MTRNSTLWDARLSNTVHSQHDKILNSQNHIYQLNIVCMLISPLSAYFLVFLFPYHPPCPCTHMHAPTSLSPFLPPTGTEFIIIISLKDNLLLKLRIRNDLRPLWVYSVRPIKFLDNTLERAGIVQSV